MQTAGIAALKQRVQEDVIGFEHRVGFELAAPVALGMLLREQEVARLRDCVVNMSQIRVDAAEPGRSGMRLLLLASDSCEFKSLSQPGNCLIVHRPRVRLCVPHCIHFKTTSKFVNPSCSTA